MNNRRFTRWFKMKYNIKIIIFREELNLGKIQ
jgi:hypothetical protein